MISWRLLFVTGFLSIALSACRSPIGHDFATTTVPEPPRELHILLVSDLHIDPFRNPPLVDQLASATIEGWPYLLQTDGDAPFATVGHDSNPALIESAFTAMQQHVPHPDAVFVAGDLLAHNFHDHFVKTAHPNNDAAYHDFVDKTAEITPLALHALYPQAQILPTVGNNDGYCGDYHSTPRDAFLAHQAKTWAPLIHENTTGSFRQTYSAGGYYETRLANGVRVLGLNSVLFSSAYENACGDESRDPAAEELHWLHAKMREHPNVPTIILTHIPPGIDGFKSFLHLGKPASFYHDETQQHLLAEFDQPHANITAMLTGHLHHIAYRTLSSKRGATRSIPVYSGPSISPIFGNTPAFAELDITAQGRITNITVYELRSSVLAPRLHPDWYQAYNFNHRYGLNGLNAASLNRLHELEQSNLSLRDTFERDRVGGGPAAAIGSLSWRTGWCAELALEPAAYLGCEGTSLH